MPYRLRDGRGESLIETLVALTVASLAMLMFAGMIFSAKRTVETGQGWNADINERTALLEQRTVSGGGVSVTSGGGTVKITTQSGDETITLIDDTGVTFFATKYGGEDGEDVISYGAP